MLPSETLRLRCDCAWCTRDRIQGRFPEAFPAVAVTKIDPLGGYAVNLGFSDGHAAESSRGSTCATSPERPPR